MPSRRKGKSANASRNPNSSPFDMPLAVFFAQFKFFSFNPEQASFTNFMRLKKAANSDLHRGAMKKGFNDALLKEFNKRFGTDRNDLATWQNLCNVLRIVPVPDNIKECRKHVRDTHVNIIDLIDAARLGTPVRLFASVQELAEYTNRTGKMLHKKNAYHRGLLMELQKKIN